MGRLKPWAEALRRDVVALSLAARDPRVPWYAKALAAAVTAYALSPIDLIPDFIPILGQLDDLVLVPLGIWAVLRLIPPPIMADLRERASTMSATKSFGGLILVLLIWAAVLTIVIRHFWTLSI